MPFLLIDSIPHTWIVYNKYSALPLPSASPRDVCLERMWMPSYLTRNGTSGAFCIFKYCKTSGSTAEGVTTAVAVRMFFEVICI